MVAIAFVYYEGVVRGFEDGRVVCSRTLVVRCD